MLLNFDKNQKIYILKTSIDKKQKEIEIEQGCGKSFNLLTKFKYQIFGSPKYKIINISPDDISFKNNNDLIYFNLEIRQKGVVLYFRYKQMNTQFTADSIKLYFSLLTTFLKFK